MIRVLQCFVTSTSTYTAEIDESVLHICFESHWIITMCVELPLSVLLVIRVQKCFVTLTLSYTAQAVQSVLHICFDSHYIIQNVRCTCFVSTASDSGFKTLCYADFNMYRSSRRTCGTYLFRFSLYYTVYSLNLLCKYY